MIIQLTRNPNDGIGSFSIHVQYSCSEVWSVYELKINWNYKMKEDLEINILKMSGEKKNPLNSFFSLKNLDIMKNLW